MRVVNFLNLRQNLRQIAAKTGLNKCKYTRLLSVSYTHLKEQMKGIYTTCIGKDTLDEAPFAYRSLEEIQRTIEETVVIRKILKPVYNFKAGGRLSLIHI